jgi:hypothetical protein
MGSASASRIAFLLFLASPAWAGTRWAGITEGTFLNSGVPDRSNGTCNYMIMGNGSGANNPTLDGMFKLAVPNLLGREIVDAVTLAVQVMASPGPPPSCGSLPNGVGAHFNLLLVNDPWTAGSGCSPGRANGSPCAGPTWNTRDCVNGWSPPTPLTAPALVTTSNAAVFTQAASCSNVANSWCSAVQGWADGGANNGVRMRSSDPPGGCHPQFFAKNMSISFDFHCRAGYEDDGSFCQACGPAHNANCVTGQGNGCVDQNPSGTASPSYRCSCAGGYVASTNPAGDSVCVNKDECVADKAGAANPCQDSGDAMATCADRAAPLQGRTCTCKSPGFIVSNQDSSTANCVASCPAPAGQSDPCSIGGTIAGSCSGSGGSWVCNCPSGYVSTGGNQPQCIPFDACGDTTHGAVGNQRCQNGIGGNACHDLGGSSTGYTCSCGAGYSNTGGATPSCVDTDDCSPNHCLSGGDSGALCFDHAAPQTGYDCRCSSGLWQLATSGGFVTCVDRDECLAGPSPSPCGRGACTNLPEGGGYVCACDRGFVSTGGKTPACVDPDACALTGAACLLSQGNSCVDNPGGGHRCRCGGAYTASLDGRSCVDKNECAIDHCGDGGDRGASCVDARAPAAGYSCECSSGFLFDGTTCADVNECVGGANPCGHGTCSNSVGGYECSCSAGFRAELRDSALTCVSDSGHITVTTIPGSGCGCQVGARPEAPLFGILWLLAIGQFLRRCPRVRKRDEFHPSNIR